MNFKFLDKPRPYALLTINNQRKVCCLVGGEWIIDSKSQMLNEYMPQIQPERMPIIGWLDTAVTIKH